MTTFSQNIILGLIISMSVVVVTRHFFGAWSNRQLAAFIALLEKQPARPTQWLGRALAHVLPQKSAGACGGDCANCGACPSSTSAPAKTIATTQTDFTHVVTLSEPNANTR